MLTFLISLEAMNLYGHTWVTCPQCPQIVQNTLFLKLRLCMYLCYPTWVSVGADDVGLAHATLLKRLGQDTPTRTSLHTHTHIDFYI